MVDKERGEKTQAQFTLINISLVPLKRAVSMLEISFMKRFLFSETFIYLLDCVHKEGTHFSL